MNPLYEKECILLVNCITAIFPTGNVNSLFLNLTHSNLLLMLTLIQAVSEGNWVQCASLFKPCSLAQLSSTPVHSNLVTCIGEALLKISGWICAGLATLHKAHAIVGDAVGFRTSQKIILLYLLSWDTVSLWSSYWIRTSHLAQGSIAFAAILLLFLPKGKNYKYDASSLGCLSPADTVLSCSHGWPQFRILLPLTPQY